MKIGMYIFLLIFGISSTIYAGSFRMTIHSRANCLNNESITWWDGHPHEWRVLSTHAKGNSRHVLDTGWMYNFRVAAVHWGEGNSGGWRVWGLHWDLNYSSRDPFGQTYAEGCNITEGW